MAKHMEDVVDVRDVMNHLRTAQHAYEAHAEQMDKVADAGGLEDFMTPEAARGMADNHRDNVNEVIEMLTALSGWYYGEDE